MLSAWLRPQRPFRLRWLDPDTSRSHHSPSSLHAVAYRDAKQLATGTWSMREKTHFTLIIIWTDVLPQPYSLSTLTSTTRKRDARPKAARSRLQLHWSLQENLPSKEFYPRQPSVRFGTSRRQTGKKNELLVAWICVQHQIWPTAVKWIGYTCPQNSAGWNLPVT